MEKIRKKYLKSAIIIPVVAAIIATALYFGLYLIMTRDVSIIKDSYELSSFVEGEVLTIEEEVNATGKLELSSLPMPESNMIFGSASLGGTSFELIYNANSINATNRLNLTESSSLIGECGTAFLSCNKAAGEPIFKLVEGDKISLDTYYGEFEYTVASVLELGSRDELDRCADELGNALVIYTDGNTGYGVSDTYYALVCEKTAGIDLVN